MLLCCLPAELVDRILSYLDSANLKSVASTSSYIYQYASDRIWAEPCLRLNAPPAGLPLLDVISSHGRRIQKLAFPPYDNPDLVDLRAMFEYMGDLMEVDLSGCPPFSIGDKQAIHVLQSCPNLVSINFDDCLDITNATGYELAMHPNARSFQTVSLNRCIELDDYAIMALVSAAPNLRTLRIACLPSITANSIHAIAAHCLNIECLHMTDLDALTDTVLETLLERCPQLRDLDISECRNISEEGLLMMGQYVHERVEWTDWRGATTLKSRIFTHLRLRSIARNTLTPRALESLFYPCTICPDLNHDINVSDGDTMDLDEPPEEVTISQPQCRIQSLRALREHLQMLELNEPTLSPGFFTVLKNSHSVFLDTFICTLASTLPTIAPTTYALSLNDFLSTQTNLHTLNLSGCASFIDDSVCIRIAAHLPHLTNFDCSGCPLVTDQGISAIADGCTLLDNINLKECTNITDDSIFALVRPRMEFSRLTDSAMHIDHPQTTPRPPLRFINLGLCDRVTDASVAALSDLVAFQDSTSSGCPSAGMHTLKVSGCFRITDASISHFSAALQTHLTTTSSSNLKLLCLSGCYNLTSSALTSLTTHLSLLESLNLFSCPNVDDSTLACIASHCRKLNSLVVSKCRLSTSGAIALATMCTELHTLYMGFLLLAEGVGNDGVRALLKGCKQLKLLDVSRSESVTDAVFAEALGAGRKGLALQVLIMKACPRVRVAGLKVLVRERAPRLQRLDLSGCIGVSVEEKRELAMGFG
ncbi:hypothetical protein BJ742DRAFT_776407 [Cladochytrium replicatum]|nr:hypothetical protein BJ742DRAFT_776407 [Cladochytrium replicatum]